MANITVLIAGFVLMLTASGLAASDIMSTAEMPMEDESDAEMSHEGRPRPVRSVESEEPVMHLQRRATVDNVPALTDCTCGTVAPTTPLLLIQCCNYYNKCCTDARIACPPPVATATTGGLNNCPAFGPFCRYNSQCPGSGDFKCCQNTSGASPIPNYMCCYRFPAP